MEEKAKQVAQLLKVLANENRLLILCALIESPLTVSELIAKLGMISQSGVSQHLSILRANGILRAEKIGQKMIYHISDARVCEVMKVLKESYCTS